MWNEMNSVPKDGTRILLKGTRVYHRGPGVVIGHWCSTGYLNIEGQSQYNHIDDLGLEGWRELYK